MKKAVLPSIVALKWRDGYEMGVLREESSWMMASQDVVAAGWLKRRLEIEF